MFVTLKFKLNDLGVDLNKDWEGRHVESIKKHYGNNPLDCCVEDIKAALTSHGLEVDQAENTPPHSVTGNLECNHG